MPAHLPQYLNADNTLGAAFLGNIVAAVLYGITCLQTFVYYKKSQSDHPAFRALIYFLWILDSLHLVFVTHSLYYYVIKNAGRATALLSPNWSILAQVYLTCISDLIIRGIYGQRVWKVSRSITVAALIALTSLVTCATGFAFASMSIIEKMTFEDFSRISYHMYTALTCAAAADIFIAVSFCLSISKSRTGFTATDSMVTTLMMYAVNSSALTTVCSIACLITYTLWPDEFTFIGIYFCLSKLFFNSLLAMLNGRESLKKQSIQYTGSKETGPNFVFETGQAHLQQSTSNHSEPSTAISKHPYGKDKETMSMQDLRLPVMVSVKRHVTSAPDA